MIYGKLTYKDIEFNFVLKNDELDLIPQEQDEEKSEMLLMEKLENGGYTYKTTYIEEPYLTGICSKTGEKIVIVPSGNAIGSYNSILTISVDYIIRLKNNDKIARMVFCAKELNYIYDVRSCVENHSYDSSGVLELKLHSFDKTFRESNKISIDGKDIICSIDISRMLNCKVTEHPITVRTLLKVQFDPTDDYMFLIKIYKVIKKFIQYLVYRKNIYFEKVELQKLNETEKYEKIGYLDFYENNHNFEKDNIIEKRFIPYNYIFGIEDKIIEDISNNYLYTRHFPFSYDDGKTINEARFVLITSAFEWEFKRLFPTGIPTSEEREAIQEQVNFTIQEKIDNTTGKEKKVYKNLLNFVSLEGFDGNLKYALEQINDVILPFGKQLYGFNGEKLNYEKIGERVAKQRNYFAHGDLDKDFIGLSLLDIIFLERVVYALQLKYFGLTDDNIKHCLNKLFNCNIML